MTFAPYRHAPTYRHETAAAAPPPISLTTGEVEGADFALTDLATGGAVALTLHRLRVPLPDRLSRVQYRVDEGEAVDLPLPARCGVFGIDALETGVTHIVRLRLVDFDPDTGEERFGAWSPAGTVTPTEAAPTDAARMIPPTVEDFGRATLETAALSDEALPFTVFGDETADSRATPARAFGLVGATVTAPGAGYTDGEHVIAVAGGEGGRLRMSVAGGAVVSAAVEAEGRGFAGAATVDLSGLPNGSGATVSAATGLVRPDWWPAVNDGATRASWEGRTLGADGFVVEGVVADGVFRPAGADHTLASGIGLRMEADGHWTLTANGTTADLAEDEGERFTVGVVVGNGATRAVLAMDLGFAGDGPRPMRIVGMPMIAGSGRLGDRLVALPGHVAGGTRPGISVRYEWLVDGALSDASSGPTLRLTPAVADVGAAVAVRVIWTDGAREERWETPAITVLPWKVAGDGDALRLGALTPSDADGLPIGPAGTAIAAGDGAGLFAIEDREGVAFLRPAATTLTPGSDPVAAGSGLAPGDHALTLSDGRALTVTLEANAFTCASLADLGALAQEADAAQGLSAYALDFASGARIVLWNSGGFGTSGAGVEALSLVARDAPVIVESYDPAEPTAVTGPVGLSAARDLVWRVDLIHGPGTGTGDGRIERTPILRIDRLAATVTIEEATVRGATLMRERTAGHVEPAGLAIGGALAAMDGEAPGRLVLSRVAAADLGAMVETGAGTDLAAFEMRDARVHRCGPRAIALGAGVGRAALSGVVVHDPTWPSPARPGAFLSVDPTGATGYDPVYRPGMGIEITDCAFFPGQGGVEAMDGIVLGRDRALGDGAAEADHGFVYDPVVIERSLILTGGEALVLGCGRTGRIVDCTLLADARAPEAAAGLTHDNAWRPLGSGFVLTRTLAGRDGLGAGVSRSGVAEIAPADYAATFLENEAGFAPRTQAGLGAFQPRLGTAPEVDGLAGAIDEAGALEADLSGVPSRAAVFWGRGSWGADAMASAIGWGAMMTQPDEPFEIKATRTTGVAPLGVHFELTGLTVEERLYDTVIWDFAEEYEFTSLPPWARVPRSARFAQGYLAVHVFTAPGTYAVTATLARRDGSERVAQATITVADPDEHYVYRDRRTICVSLAGDFTDAPADAELYGDLDRAFSAFNQRGRHRILFRAGERFAWNKHLWLVDGSQASRFGPASDPNPVVVPLEDGWSATPFRVRDAEGRGGAALYDIDIVGTYDPSAPADPSEHPEHIMGGISAVKNAPPVTILRCNFQGLGIAVSIPGNTAEGGGVTADCSISDWFDYGLMSNLFRAGIVGCSIAQHREAVHNLTGGKHKNDGRNPNAAKHGPLRSASARDVVIAQSYFESWNSWTSREGGDPHHQPCLRLSTSGSEGNGVVVDNHLVSGQVIAALVSTNSHKFPYRGSKGYVFSNNFFEATRNTRTVNTIHRAPLSSYNNIYSFMNGWNGGDRSNFGIAIQTIDNHQDGYLDLPMHARNETLYSDTDEAIVLWQHSDLTPKAPGTNWRNVEEHNTAVHAPATFTDHDMLDGSPLHDFAPATAPHPWLGVAQGRVPRLDARGQVRPAAAGLGALELFAPATVMLGAGAGGGRLTGALPSTGGLTVAARLRRDGAGRLDLFRAGADHALALDALGERLILTLAGADGTGFVDVELDGLAPTGTWLSLLLAVDPNGGLAQERTASLWVDGVERYATFAGGPAALADQSTLAFLGGDAPGALEHWFWASGSVALDPAERWSDFFGPDGRVRDLGHAGTLGPRSVIDTEAFVVPDVFVQARCAYGTYDAEPFRRGVNLGRGGALAVDGTFAIV